MTKEISEEKECPLVLKPWIFIYERVPKVLKIPFTNTSITFTILSSFTLLQVNFFIRRFIIPSHFPDDEKVNIYLTSIVHSSSLCPPLLALLVTQSFIPSAAMKQAPQWWQSGANALLEFCTGYMLYDGLWNSVYLNYIPELGGFQLKTEDWCFLGHHVATSFYMTSVRLQGAGHLSAMIIMFFGEVTNPFQNSRRALQDMMEMGDCCSSQFMKETLYPIIDFCYALLYAIIRVGLNPYLNVRITYDFLMTKGGRKRMSLPLSFSLLFMLWGVTLGTIPWCFESVDIVKTYMMNFASTSTSSKFQEL